ncbi:hydrogenase nickel incorporation protein HybF [Yersinia frederiksenii]|uniref:hydrogenase maturation nickel metallochaperone HypA n=1 Tax=Yersinia alsatica TaxID=2890317 RepID=UPI0005E0377C|nr:hydrogenase maturation nickel metallochaperone HypA [Yersinia alsatica]CFQ54321.1 hydrogenase nickel incorporation protein HybF [Yersinia frederiksenii]CNH44342.1 hydrogenase nickel incorporation protein HybF [Yersinia frederiksenii]CNI11055.1 hydrogenase nickel incorporation protein HybF [Yersinia frederiksenii]CNI22457.1 hydrogenase nickel incorporation protein HybF [Yersinia frederiksenii]CNK28657.1 hydrogenase nickel incorporation protein HybF [Yersinia frederiksenii]
MHEISLCLSTLELIEKQAQLHGATRITAVWLEIGALSCIEESALRFSFDSASRQTLAAGCQLHLSYQPAKAWCWECSTSVAIERHDAGCPHCGSHALQVESGSNLQVKQIEVE